MMLMGSAWQMFQMISTSSRCFHRAAEINKIHPLDHRSAIDCTSRTTRSKPVKDHICSRSYNEFCAGRSISTFMCDQFKKMSGVQAKAPKCRTELMWKTLPKSCNKCDDRFDVLFYQASDKFRPLQRTWWECCPRLVPKLVCRWSDAIPPQVKRHKNKASKGCSSIAMPSCRARLVPPKCSSWKPCKKIKCPFPSYSECIRRGLIKELPHECRCLERHPICFANLFARKPKSIYPCQRS